MRSHLQASDRVFSGFKTFHELNESFPQLLDEKGNRKPFEQFLNDVRKVGDTYNRRYLNAEYNFAQASAEMAGRWENFDDAIARGRRTLQNDSKGMFKFNPGKQQKTFPDYNPYTISKCKTCPKAGLKLSAGIAHSELCKACAFIGTEVCGYESVKTDKGRVRQHKTQSPDEWEENRSIAVYLANKYGYDIDLTPITKGKKNADSFNHTLGYKQEYKVNLANTYNSYDRAIKEGRKQAGSIVISLADEADFDILSHAMNNRCKYAMGSKSPVSDITLIWKGQDCTFSNKEIISDGFKIRKESFR